MAPQLEVGDYARIIDLPEAWEGSGEDEEDRMALLGHVGLVIEIDDDPNDYTSCHCALLRFPWLNEEGITGQRNVELSVLEFVSRPIGSLPTHLIENSGPGPDEIIQIGNTKYRRTYTIVKE